MNPETRNKLVWHIKGFFTLVAGLLILSFIMGTIVLYFL